MPSIEKLSPRERQVFKAMAHGVKLRDIARALGISEHTAKQHKKRIYEKLDVHTQVELMRRYVQKPTRAAAERLLDAVLFEGLKTSGIEAAVKNLQDLLETV